jgi:hypothetical protein
MKVKIVTKYRNYTCIFKDCSTIIDVREWLNGSPGSVNEMADFIDLLQEYSPL